jgi:hypothetical protein
MPFRGLCVCEKPASKAAIILTVPPPCFPQAQKITRPGCRERVFILS